MTDELQRHINKIMNARNMQGIPDFEGYSPFEMNSILYDPFGDNSPVQLLKLSALGYQAIPILNQVKYLAGLIENRGEIKLTAKGFLPTKIVADIYSQDFIKDEHIESGISKLYKETDSLTIYLSRILLEMSGLTKKRNNKLSLTKIGTKTLHDDSKLFLVLIKTFGTKFNWAYYDRFGDNNIGQKGFGFSLILLGKYGHKKKTDRFYAKKYFTALPQLQGSPVLLYGTEIDYSPLCYSLRTFDRFMHYFGLIKIEKRKELDADKYISKTTIFDKLIYIRPHSRH